MERKTMPDRVKEKLVEIIQNSVGGCARHWAEVIADGLIANGVTVQEWISVKDRLPKIRDDGFVDAFLVTDGSLAHIAYFVDGEWIFTDNGEMKQPMFYDVTHWCYLPQPPKGE